jgi:hypothetical protein
LLHGLGFSLLQGLGFSLLQVGSLFMLDAYAQFSYQFIYQFIYHVARQMMQQLAKLNYTRLTYTKTYTRDKLEEDFARQIKLRLLESKLGTLSLSLSLSLSPRARALARERERERASQRESIRATGYTKETCS